MKNCVFLLIVLLIGCAPSLIQREINSELNIRYEIKKNEEKEIKRSALRIADSLTKIEIKKNVSESQNMKDLNLKIHINDLKWFCPDRAKIEAEGFAVGLTGGLIGATIWGSKNFTTVYGISHISVQESENKEVVCNDTINFTENYLNYSSSKAKKRAISEAYKKSLDCALLKIKTSDNLNPEIETENPPQ